MRNVNSEIALLYKAKAVSQAGVEVIFVGLCPFRLVFSLTCFYMLHMFFRRSSLGANVEGPMSTMRKPSKAKKKTPTLF